MTWLATIHFTDGKKIHTTVTNKLIMRLREIAQIKWFELTPIRKEC